MIDFGYGVVLDTIDPHFSEMLRRWRNDPRVWKWCRQNDLIDQMSQDRWLERQSADPTIKMYLIREADEDKFPIGVCGLTSIDQVNRRAEFSLYVDPDKWGKGYGERGLRTLLLHGFKNLGLHCIWGESFAGNPAMRMFDKIGFKQDGKHRKFYFRDGQFVDSHIFSILGSEFLSGGMGGEKKSPDPEKIYHTPVHCL